MKDEARRLVMVTQDPEGYPPGLRDSAEIPVRAHSVVHEEDYRKVLDEVNKLEEILSDVITSRLKKSVTKEGPWEIRVCPECGKMGNIIFPLAFSRCTGSLLTDEHEPTAFELVKVVPMVEDEPEPKGTL